jgi:hypothetical protein
LDFVSLGFSPTLSSCDLDFVPLKARLKLDLIDLDLVGVSMWIGLCIALGWKRVKRVKSGGGHISLTLSNLSNLFCLRLDWVGPELDFM